MARDEEKYRYWCEQIKGWEASGLTQTKYCLQEQLNASVFGYWLGEKRKVDRENAALLQSPNKSLTFMPVQMANKAGPLCAAQDWILRSPAGWELRRPGDSDANWLIAILKELA